MEGIQNLLQTADWKSEKHVPVIECSDYLQKGKYSKVTVIVGKEIPHPNTTVHHIVEASLFFKPEADKFPYQIGRQEFLAHGSSVQGPDMSTIYTASEATFTFKTDLPGTLIALIYCNIHGLWQSTKSIKVE